MAVTNVHIIILLALLTPNVQAITCSEFLTLAHKAMLSLTNPAYPYFRRMRLLVRSQEHEIVTVKVPLSQIQLSHPLNYPLQYRLEKERERLTALRAERSAIELAGEFTLEDQERLMPSKGNILGVETGDAIILKDGNGRLGVLREVFGKDSDLLVEIKVVRLKHPHHQQTLISLARRAQAVSKAEKEDK